MLNLSQHWTGHTCTCRSTHLLGVGQLIFVKCCDFIKTLSYPITRRTNSRCIPTEAEAAFSSPCARPPLCCLPNSPLLMPSRRRTERRRSATSTTGRARVCAAQSTGRREPRAGARGGTVSATAHASKVTIHNSTGFVLV